MQYARVAAIAGVLSFVTAVGVAEETSRLGPGARVRVKVSTQEKRLVGKLLALDDKTLNLQVGDEEAPRVFPREQITDLDISTGRRSRGRKALYGAGIGALAGAAIGFAVDDREDDFFTPAEVAGGFALFLGSAGALIGLLANPGERWEDVPLDNVQISFRPVPGRGAGVFVSISF